MLSFKKKKPEGQVKVGDVIDAMHASDQFTPLSREDIFTVVEIFLKEYVGVPKPGVVSVVTKKFTADEAKLLAVRTGFSLENIVKIITVFRIKAGGKGGGVKSKIMNAYGKVRMKGGTRSGVKSRM